MINRLHRSRHGTCRQGREAGATVRACAVNRHSQATAEPVLTLEGCDARAVGHGAVLVWVRREREDQRSATLCLAGLPEALLSESRVNHPRPDHWQPANWPQWCISFVHGKGSLGRRKPPPKVAHKGVLPSDITAGSAVDSSGLAQPSAGFRCAPRAVPPPSGLCRLSSHRAVRGRLHGDFSFAVP